jgi:chromosome segregation ATPase
MMSQNGHPRDPQRSAQTFPSSRQPAANGHDSSSGLQEWGDDTLRQELERLAAGHRELRAAIGRARGAGEEAGDLERLRGENAELRHRALELEQALQHRPSGDEAWAEQQREYEALLEEKSEVIRTLHQKIQEMREGGEPTGRALPGGGAASQDLQAQQRQLEQQRAQLEEDEQALEQQMRQMEMAMSRERAELARQRNELQRLHNDLRREMELAARDGELRERLQPLQRRQQEVATSRRLPTLIEINVPPLPEPPKAEAAEKPGKKQNSGLFGRLFGSRPQ